MALHAVGAGDHQNGAVQHLKRPLHLGGKVHVSRRVQQGNPGIPQLQHRLLGEYGNPPLALHGVRIQKRVLMIHPSQTADRPGTVQQGLR